MVDKTVRLTHEQRENLVAYLDQELDESATQEIDDVLARSPVARHEVESLSRVWDLLDTLPRARATEEFTRQTLASLAVEDLPQSRWRPETLARARLAGQIGVWAATLAIAAGIGYYVANRAVPGPADEILRDLPVLERMEHYQDAGDAEFLRQLRRRGLFLEPPQE